MADPALLSALLMGVTLALFASDRLRPELVALLALFGGLLLGLIPPGAALRGFSDPAVMVVACVLIVGRALEVQGATAAAARTLIPESAPFMLQMALLLLVAAALSAVINNIAALAMTMPIAVHIATRAGQSPSIILMPLAFATILGGTTTLIGTPANLILSSVRADMLGEPLGFFDMTPVGIAVTAAGLVYLLLAARRLLPAGRGLKTERAAWHVFEMVARADWIEPTRPALRRAGARLLAHFTPNGERIAAPIARAGDRLMLLTRHDPESIAARLPLDRLDDARHLASTTTARVVVAHGSPVIGHGYRSIRFRSDGAVAVLAAGPRPARLRLPLDSIRIAAGDQLFLRGEPDALADVCARLRLLEVDRTDQLPLHRARAAQVTVIFAIAVAAAAIGGVAPAIAFLAAVIAVAILRLIPARDAYAAVDWPVIVLLAAMIPVGQSFVDSGAAAIVADALAAVLGQLDLFWALATMTSATLLLTVFLNNVATAVIIGPVAIGVAGITGIDPDAMLLAVLVGVSSDFLTPIGHQNNLVVMAPGGYRFRDYSRFGAPLAAIVVMTAAFVLSRAYGG